MLKGLYKDEYSDGRSSIDTGILEKILGESLKISAEVDLNNTELKKTVALLMAGIGYYFYLHPEQYVDFGKFVAYRSISLNNLWTIEAKCGENAESIYNYYKKGGLEFEEIKKLVKDYASDILEDSIQRNKKLSEDIKDMKNIISQDDKDNTQKTKENKNGI